MRIWKEGENEWLRKPFLQLAPEKMKRNVDVMIKK